MFTLEQKVDLILRYIASTDNAQRSQLKKQVVKALNSEEPIIPATPDIDDLIYDMLKSVGMPQHLDGYKYITKAIKLCILDPSYLKGITNRLYPDIAHMFGTSWSRVERCFRHAIEATFNNGDVKDIERVFGNTMSVHKGKLTNLEFVTVSTNVIRRRMKQYGIEVK